MKDVYSPKFAIGFACLGHATMHVLVTLFLTIVLALQHVWGMGYDELIELWTLGALMLGVGAPLAGWASDRFGEVRLMILFFLGAGGATILAGLAEGPTMLTVALTLLGLFAAIYHPVGLAWVVKNAIGRGRTLAIVGIAGSVGLALASLIAGGLTDLSGWRSAFVLPGAVSVAAGLVLAWLYLTGQAVDRDSDLEPVAPESQNNLVRAFVILLLTMVLSSLFYTAFATVLPKWLSTDLTPGIELDTATVGLLVTCAYLIGGTGQLAGGWLADRYPLKWVYAGTFLVKIPAALLAVTVAGWPVVAIAVAVSFTLDLSGPAENILLARYSPERRRGLVYGLKYVAGFAAAPLGVAMVAWSYRAYDGPPTLYLWLAGIGVLMLLGALLLPNDRPKVVAAPAAAE
jgi:MFS transporter, FSR family, fosmidomycin resistance protein